MGPQRVDNPLCIAMRESDVEMRRVKSRIPTVKHYNELLMEHELPKFNEDKARDYGTVIQNRWKEELWMRIDAERES